MAHLVSFSRGFLFHIRQFDWIMIGSAGALVLIGLFSLASSSLASGDLSNLWKQVFFLLLGGVVLFGVSFLDWRNIKNDPHFILFLYVLSILLLLGLFLFAPEIRGVQRWYKIGPFSLDPVEVVKIMLLFLLAKYFSGRHAELYKIRHILISSVYVLIPSIIVFFQPDLGAVLLLLVLWAGILLISGIQLKHFVALGLAGLFVFGAGWSFFLHDYQKERLTDFIAAEQDPLGGGWQQTQSKIAIGSGGLWGQGFGQGSQTQLGYLPEHQTDFIFASVAEEFGFVTISLVLFLFALLIWRITRVALEVRSNFCRLFAGGVAILLFTQIFVNVGMNLGFLPVIGLPLPLVSYGGANVLSTFLYLGILQSIRIYR